MTPLLYTLREPFFFKENLQQKTIANRTQRKAETYAQFYALTFPLPLDLDDYPLQSLLIPTNSIFYQLITSYLINQDETYDF